MNKRRLTLECFRPGTHTDSQGKELTFTAEDLKQIAAAYNAVDPSSRAPCVVGHPKTEDAAYGWIERLEFDAGRDRLIAECSDLDVQFADMVEQKRYPRVSMAFFGPTHPSSPSKGVWFPRHLGFLGAAAPAISGLKSCAFAGGEGEVLYATFSMAPADGFSVKQLFQRLRDWIIEKEGAEDGDRILPNWLIDGMVVETTKSGESPAYSATTTEVPAMSDNTNPEVVRLTAENATLTSRVAQLEQQAKDSAFAAQKTEVATFVSGLVEQKRLAPANVAATTAALLALAAAEDVTYNAADGTATKASPLALMKAQLSQAPVILDTVEKAAGTGDANKGAAAFAAPTGTSVDPDEERQRAYAAAKDYQRKHPEVSFAAALQEAGFGHLL